MYNELLTEINKELNKHDSDPENMFNLLQRAYLVINHLNRSETRNLEALAYIEQIVSDTLKEVR